MSLQPIVYSGPNPDNAPQGAAKINASLEYLEGLINELEIPAGTVEMQATDTHIQYRSGGDDTWTDVIALSELEGAPGQDGEPGPPGETGLAGSDGADADQIELRTESGYVQWRRGEGAWQNLFLIPEGGSGGGVTEQQLTAAIEAHDDDEEAHADIRAMIDSIQTQIGDIDTALAAIIGGAG